MRVWCAFTPTITLSTAAQTVTTLCDPSGFATTPANTKHIGTLLAIRGQINILGSASSELVCIGIVMADVAESVQTVSTVNFGQDEDVLAWYMYRTGGTDEAVKNIDVHIKARRRMEAENVIFMVAQTPTGSPNVTITAALRALIAIP